MKAKRRSFGRRYKPRSKSLYGYNHQLIAKQVVKNASCAMAHLGGCEGPLQADHIIPLSLGGTTDPTNYQALCQRHNIAKGGANRRRR